MRPPRPVLAPLPRIRPPAIGGTIMHKRTITMTLGAAFLLACAQDTEPDAGPDLADTTAAVPADDRADVDLFADSASARDQLAAEVWSRMAEALATSGVPSRPRGAVLAVETAGAPVDLHDLIRDTASDLGLGLVRVQTDHRRIEDVFTDHAVGNDD